MWTRHQLKQISLQQNKTRMIMTIVLINAALKVILRVLQQLEGRGGGEGERNSTRFKNIHPCITILLVQVLESLQASQVKDEDDAEMAHQVAAHLIRALIEYKQLTGNFQLIPTTKLIRKKNHETFQLSLGGTHSKIDDLLICPPPKKKKKIVLDLYCLLAIT